MAISAAGRSNRAHGSDFSEHAEPARFAMKNRLFLDPILLVF
jgi:hypothetical protein